MATGADAETVLPLVANLRGASGRLELVCTHARGAPIFVDYAHTPDALANALEALRPSRHGPPHRRVRLRRRSGHGQAPANGRDRGGMADIAIVTDDNPRSEEPAAIRREILRRHQAHSRSRPCRGRSAEAVADLKPGDVLLIAGKGHETGQIVKGAIFPYSDHDAIAVALKRRGEACLSRCGHWRDA